MKYRLNCIGTFCTETERSESLDTSPHPVVKVDVDENSTYMGIKLRLLDTDSILQNVWQDIDEEAYVEAVHEFFINFTTLTYVPDILYDVGNMWDSIHDWNLYMWFTIETIDESEA